MELREKGKEKGYVLKTVEKWGVGGKGVRESNGRG
jgi:hypothetical protein